MHKTISVEPYTNTSFTEKTAAIKAIDIWFIKTHYNESLGSMSLESIYDTVTNLPEVYAYRLGATSPENKLTRRWIINTQINTHLVYYISNKVQ